MKGNTTSMKNTREFVVFGVTANTNSFGLTGMHVMDRDGESWEIWGNHLRKKEINDVITATCNVAGTPRWSWMGYEMPERLCGEDGVRLPDAPEEVVKHVWRNAGTAVPA